MESIPRKFRLSTKSEAGVQCDAEGLFLGAAPLLERDFGEAAWRPRPTDQLNRDLTKRYGLPVDFSSKLGGLTAVCRALDRGDLPYAQMRALQLRLPELPEGTSAGDHAKLAKIAIGLQESGLLTKVAWDESKHPRWPAGSQDSTGGQFAPAGEGGSSPARSKDSERSNSAEAAVADHGRTLKAQMHVDANGDYVTKFYIEPPSKVGGVIVQKVVSTDKLYGGVDTQVVGWEAWPIKPGEMAMEGSVDDRWRAPPPDSQRPSVAMERTIVAEARFYEGITIQDLINNYGFSAGGSGFSGDLPSTKRDPHLPTDRATPPVTRQRTFTKW